LESHLSRKIPFFYWKRRLSIQRFCAVIVVKWGYITLFLVWKFSLAEERNPILYFPGKSWPAAGDASLGSELSIFWMPPSILNYKNNFGSNRHHYQYLWAKISFGEPQNGLL
jgi:hypothetical protein